jgi:hypothetical protein
MISSSFPSTFKLETSKVPVTNVVKTRKTSTEGNLKTKSTATLVKNYRLEAKNTRAPNQGSRPKQSVERRSQITARWARNRPVKFENFEAKSYGIT